MKNNLSFAHEIKIELLENVYEKEDMKYFIKGLLDSSKKIADFTYTLQFSDLIIFEKVISLFQKYAISHTRLSRTMLKVEFREKFNENELIFSYFAGVFVAGGSINSLQSSSYHFEIKFHDSKIAKSTLSFLNNNEFDFTIINRKSKYILYMKKSKLISSFIGAIGAVSSMMKFEEILIERDMNNYANRYSNFDTYNSLKMVEANQRFIEMYDWVIENKLQYKFKEYEIDFFELKKKHKYDSLDVLKDIFNKKNEMKKTKSAINHWLIKLRTLYEEFN